MRQLATMYFKRRTAWALWAKNEKRKVKNKKWKMEIKNLKTKN